MKIFRNSIKLLQLTLVSGFLALTIGCGKTQTLSHFPESGADLQSLPEMNELHSKVAEVDSQTTAVLEEISDLNFQNPLNLLGGNLLNSVKLFSGFSQELQKKIEELKTKLNDQLSQLDPNNPHHRQMISQLQNALNYMDQINSRLGEVFAKLESKINEMFAKIQQKISGLLSGIPGMIAQMVLGQLKSSILNNLIGR